MKYPAPKFLHLIDKFSKQKINRLSAIECKILMLSLSMHEVDSIALAKKLKLPESEIIDALESLQEKGFEAEGEDLS